MRAEQLQLALRPRPMYEAVDLGVRMAQRALPSLGRAYLPLALALVVACGTTMEIASWLPSALLWWLKPWLDRTLLHVYARQAFGETTTLREALAARAAAPWQATAYWLTLGRLSFWRSYAMPVTQLEGQAGAERRKRLRIVLGSHRGAATMVTSTFSWLEMFLILGVLSLFYWLTPGLLGQNNLAFLTDGSLAGELVPYAAQAAAVLFVEPFFVAAGFAMYLNRRVELEAWDVEQALREAFDAR